MAVTIDVKETTLLLPALYHWSPAGRFDEIRREGLRPHCTPTVTTSVSLPYVCLSPTASRAWSLSGAMEWMSEEEVWDLWEVRLADGDDVRIRPDFGPEILEIKVYGPVPADRVYWVGRRGPSPVDTCIPVADPDNLLRVRDVEVSHGINVLSVTVHGRWPGATTLNPDEADALADLLRRQAAYARTTRAEDD